MNSNRLSPAWAAVALIALTPCTGVSAQAAPPPNAPIKPKGVDADAWNALDRMGVALRNLNAFTIHADITYEDVLNSGEKLQHAGEVAIQTLRPNRLKIVATSDHREREIFFDGKALTVVAPRVGYYASVPAPSTIGGMLKDGKDKYGIELPLTDLFTWGTDPGVMARLRSGFDAGPEKIGGLNCEHYAFRQDRIDWQVWIRSDGPALPCKLIITTTSDLSRPQYVAVLNWNVGQVPVPADFVFTPPAGIHRIAMVDASARDQRSPKAK